MEKLLRPLVSRHAGARRTLRLLLRLSILLASLTPAALAQPGPVPPAAASCPNPAQRIEVTLKAVSTPAGLSWAIKEKPGAERVVVCERVQRRILDALRRATLSPDKFEVAGGLSFDLYLMQEVNGGLDSPDISILSPAALATPPTAAGQEVDDVLCVILGNPDFCTPQPAAGAEIEVATASGRAATLPGIPGSSVGNPAVPVKFFYSAEDLAAARKDPSVTDDAQAHARVREELTKVAEAIHAAAVSSGGLGADGRPAFDDPNGPTAQRANAQYIGAMRGLYKPEGNIFDVGWLADVTPVVRAVGFVGGAGATPRVVWGVEGLRLVEAVNIEVLEESWETSGVQGETIAAKLRARRQAAYDKLNGPDGPALVVRPGRVVSLAELGRLTQADVAGTGDLRAVEARVEAVEKVKSGPVVTPTRPAAPGAPEGRNLIYAVRRKKKAELSLAFQLGGSYSAEEGGAGRVGVEGVNLLRLKETIGLSAQVGGEVQRYRFSFTRPFESSGKPGFELKNFSVDAKVFKDKDRRLGNLTAEEIEAREVGSSADLSFGYDSLSARERANADCLAGPDRPPRTRYGFLADVGLNYRDVNIREDDQLLTITGVARELLPRERTQATTVSLAVQAVLRHDFRRPGRAGPGVLVLRLDEDARKGFRLFGADYEYWKTRTVFSADLTFGFSSFRDMFVAYRHGRERGSEGTPIFELPLLGGASSVRGLEEGEFIGRSLSYDQFEFGVNAASVYKLLARKGRLGDNSFCPFAEGAQPAGPFDPRNLYVKGFFDHARLSDSPVAPPAGGSLRRANGYGFAVELRDMLADASGRRVNLSIGYGRSPHSRLHRSGMIVTGVTFEF